VRRCSVRSLTPIAPSSDCRGQAGTLYEVLDVPRAAGPRDIKAAFRRKALALHPDVNKAVRLGPGWEQRCAHPAHPGA